MHLKTPEEIELMAEGGNILADVLDELAECVVAGRSAEELDALAEKRIRQARAEPAFKNYKPEFNAKPFPATLCVSLNDVVVHGLPKASVVLKGGDIVSLDLGVKYRGFYTDAALSVGVQPLTQQARRLIGAARESLLAGVHAVVVGGSTGAIGEAIHAIVKRSGFRIIKNLCGHGIGRELHEEPQVLNYKRGSGVPVVPGMVFTIEPMVSLTAEYAVAADDESYVTADGSPAAHFEATIAVTEKGVRVLTPFTSLV